MSTDTEKKSALESLERMKKKFTEAVFLQSVADGRQEVVKLFLEAGMDANVMNAHDEPAIVVAAKNGRDSIVALLYEEGAKMQDLVKHFESAKTSHSWEKTAAAVSPYVSTFATFVVAAASVIFTFNYNYHQQAIQKVQLVSQTIPYLSKPETRASGLIAVQMLDPKLGERLISAMTGPEAIQAARQIAGSLVDVKAQQSYAKSVAPVLSSAKQDALAIAVLYLDRKPPIKYEYGEKTPEEGFDPASFVAYVFSQVGLVSKDMYQSFNSSALQRRYGLQPISDPNSLHPGDLIFYADGNCQIYEGKDSSGKDQMIGILASKGLTRTPFAQVLEDNGPHRLLGAGYVAINSGTALQ